MKNKYLIIYMLLCMLFQCQLFQIIAQPAPAKDENIPFLVTFGKDSETSWGDDDFSQIFFFLIPEESTEPVYLRIYDPSTGGKYDEAKGAFDTEMDFAVYGGEACWSNEDAQAVNPIGNYKSGILLSNKTFSNEAEFDGKWYTLGPFSPFDGEYVEKFHGKVFKVIADGLKGDDGNLYRYFVSTHPDKNIPVEGGNIFTYEYVFRLSNNQNHISQIYPFIDDKTISVKITNFDWDSDGEIRLFSNSKNGLLANISAQNNWEQQEFLIVEDEKNTSLQIQFIKNKKELVKNNNVTITLQNQYGVSLPFFVIPIGGIPKYRPKVAMQKVN